MAGKWLGRSLSNYIKMHKDKAAKDGTQLMQAQTLTAARKIVFGEKHKTLNCSSCSHKSCVCGKGK